MGGTVIKFTAISIAFILTNVTSPSMISNSTLPRQFLDLNIPQKRTSSSQSSLCMSESVISCVQVKIDLEVVKQADIISLPNETILKIKSRNGHSSTYQNQLAEAYFVWDKVTIVGKITMPGKIWSIQGCGNTCYLWIEHTQKGRYDIEALPVPPGPMMERQLIEYQEEDPDTIVTVTNMVYYTPTFRDSFVNDDELNAYIDLVFLEANTGYQNSGISLRIQVHCKELIEVIYYEGLTAGHALQSFQGDASRKDADTASLWAESFDYYGSRACGVAYVDVSTYCDYAYSVISKTCAMQGYGFAHELGHNFGSWHKIEL